MYLIFGYTKGMQRKDSKLSTADYKTQLLQTRKIKEKLSQSISFSVRIKQQNLLASRSLRQTDLGADEYLCIISCIYLALYKKMKFFFRDFFIKCYQICSFLRIWSHLLKKSLLENFIFRAVS